jgi:predicted phosphodiesterase
MKLHVISDLHLEFARYEPSNESYLADVIILAGDIHLGTAGLQWARATWPEHEIIYIAGNHEFYRSSRPHLLADCQAVAKENGIHFLENERVLINDVRFLGCSLWTDFALFGEHRLEEALSEVQDALNDFRYIWEEDWRFTAVDSLKLHKASRTWLMKELQSSFDGTTVVVTHHAPSSNSVAPRFKDDIVSAGFASQLDDIIVLSSLWIHGHMHDSFDYVLQGTRVICNPRGYAPKDASTQENAHFNPRLLIDLD